MMVIDTPVPANGYMDKNLEALLHSVPSALRRAAKLLSYEPQWAVVGEATVKMLFAFVYEEIRHHPAAYRDYPKVHSQEIYVFGTILYRLSRFGYVAGLEHRFLEKEFLLEHSNVYSYLASECCENEVGDVFVNRHFHHLLHVLSRLMPEAEDFFDWMEEMGLPIPDLCGFAKAPINLQFAEAEDLARRRQLQPTLPFPMPDGVWNKPTSVETSSRMRRHVESLHNARPCMAAKADGLLGVMALAEILGLRLSEISGLTGDSLQLDDDGRYVLHLRSDRTLTVPFHIGKALHKQFFAPCDERENIFNFSHERPNGYPIELLILPSDLDMEWMDRSTQINWLGGLRTRCFQEKQKSMDFESASKEMGCFGPHERKRMLKMRHQNMREGTNWKTTSDEANPTFSEFCG